jgi:predicted HicB family RNase H-like nuclease
MATSPGSRRQTSLRIPDYLYDDCRIEADRRGISINKLIVESVESYMKKPFQSSENKDVKWWEKKKFK